MKAGDEIQAAPDVELHMEDESLVIHDDVTIATTSPAKFLRDACIWLEVSQSGSKKGLFARCEKAKETVLRRNVVESAHVQHKSLQKKVESIPMPAQPTDRDRPFLELAHVPCQPWCKYCVMSRSRANQRVFFSAHFCCRSSVSEDKFSSGLSPHVPQVQG